MKGLGFWGTHRGKQRGGAVALVSRGSGWRHGRASAADPAECSLVTLAVLTAQFRDDGQVDSAPVADFLDCAAAVLRAEVERPDALQ